MATFVGIVEMAQDLKSRSDAINAGAPVPPVAPGDLSIALVFLREARCILDRSASQRAPDAPLAGSGFMLDDLATRCSAGADILSIGVRAALADVILQLADAKTDRPGGADTDFIIREVATMPLIGEELKDPKAILARLDEMTGT